MKFPIPFTGQEGGDIYHFTFIHYQNLFNKKGKRLVGFKFGDHEADTDLMEKESFDNRYEYSLLVKLIRDIDWFIIYPVMRLWPAHPSTFLAKVLLFPLRLYIAHQALMHIYNDKDKYTNKRFASNEAWTLANIFLNLE